MIGSLSYRGCEERRDRRLGDEDEGHGDQEPWWR